MLFPPTIYGLLQSIGSSSSQPRGSVTAPLRARDGVDDLREVSYEDRPLPIGYGQTISQPLIVALMTDVLNVDRASVVLEVGTGSGYQAAVVAELARQVYTIEIIPDLARSTTERLRRLGTRTLRCASGTGISDGPRWLPSTELLSPREPLTSHHR